MIFTQPQPVNIYQQPKQGLFKIHSGQWGSKGWVNDEREYTIIAEDEHHYIYKFMPTDERYIFNKLDNLMIEVEIEKGTFFTPIGIHKSRFIKWLSTQLTLL